MGRVVLQSSVLALSLGFLAAIFCLTFLASPWEQEIHIGNSLAGESWIAFSTLMVRPIVLVAVSCLMLMRAVRWRYVLALSLLLLLILNQFWLDLFGLLSYSIPILEPNTWFISTVLILVPMLYGRIVGFQLRNSLTNDVRSPREPESQPYRIRPTVLQLVLATTLVAVLAAWLGSATESSLQNEVTWPLVVCGTAILNGYILLSDTRWYLQVAMLTMLTIGTACLLLGTGWRSMEELSMWAFAAQFAECMTLVGWCIAVFGGLRGLGWRLFRTNRLTKVANMSQGPNFAAAGKP